MSDLKNPKAEVFYWAFLSLEDEDKKVFLNKLEDKFIYEAMFSGDQTFLSEDESECFLKNLRDRSL